MNRVMAALAVWGLGCGSLAGPVPDTGLQGMVTYGPIQPVCREDEPCDAPLRARFDVEQAGRVVARFESDANGRFEVRLLPGSYVVIPDAKAVTANKVPEAVSERRSNRTVPSAWRLTNDQLSPDQLRPFPWEREAPTSAAVSTGEVVMRSNIVSPR